ncbi:MAG: T9SS type A sorting domain-containing protein, partial [Cytophagales bacterium]
ATNATFTASAAGVYRVQVTVDDCVSDFSADRSLFAPQSITFPPIADQVVGSTAFQLAATASSNLPVSYSTTSDKITISNSTVTIAGAGRVVVRASQTGNASFAAATDVTRSFCIRPAKPSITTSGTDAETITLTSSASVGNRWFLNGAAIPSATNSTYAANQAGVYTVQVTVDDCISDLSTALPLIITGDLPGMRGSVSVYPNPAESYFELSGMKGALSNVQLLDLSGRRNSIELEKRGEVHYANVQHRSLGVYLLQVQDEVATHRIKIIKK